MWPCFYGIDTDTRDQLIAANMTQRRDVRVDRRRLAGVHQLCRACATACPTCATPGFCEACFSGEYPVDIPAYTARNSFMTKADFAAAYEKEAQS